MSADVTRGNPLSGLNRRSLLLGGVLAVAGGTAMARQPRIVAPPVTKAGLDRLLPNRIAGWTYETSSGVVLPPSDAMSDLLYNALATKVYQRPGRSPVMLLVAYSNRQDGTLQVHRPEFCYPAGGYDLSPTQHVEIANGLGGTISANAFSASGISRTEQVLYWTRIGDRFPTRWVDQRLTVVEANLRGEVPDGVLVRVSTLDGDLGQALPELSAFAAALLRETSPAGRALLAGRTA